MEGAGGGGGRGGGGGGGAWLDPGAPLSDKEEVAGEEEEHCRGNCE